MPRPRLLRRLEERRGRPLTLVFAPARYGKIILVSSWLEASDCLSAWVPLDEEDDDLGFSYPRTSPGNRWRSSPPATAA